MLVNDWLNVYRNVRENVSRSMSTNVYVYQHLKRLAKRLHKRFKEHAQNRMVLRQSFVGFGVPYTCAYKIVHQFIVQVVKKVDRQQWYQTPQGACTCTETKYDEKH